MGCDTFVALAPATRDGVTVFAKNSDRPPYEAQRLVRLPRRHAGAGARVRTQYLEIDDVADTHAILGSQPWWLWGLEHGVNEHRVAIGNETVFAKETLGATGLIGMDLVRLGLERGGTATEALDVMIGLLERHGQGGSGQHHLEFPYHNAFLVADPREAWILETSQRHWAARRVHEVGNVSNGLAIGSDWDRASGDLTTYAVARGWWQADAGPVDFATAYADDVGVPPNLANARRSRGACLLTEGRGQLGGAAMRALLRDHYDGGPVHHPRAFDDEQFFSICMHGAPLDNTTAGMVAPLPADDRIVTTWVALGSPCVGVFLPVYLEGVLPASLTDGGADDDPDSLWWAMRRLLTLVERDFGRWGPLVRERLDPVEDGLVREAPSVEAAAMAARAAGRPDEVSTLLSAFTQRSAASYRRHVDALTAAIGGD